MENSPLVSIVIPVYNVEKYIGVCLDSCLEQTYKNIEVILVDDGSSDCSAEIVDGYVARDGRIRQFRQENQGVAAARNRGVKLSVGDYIVHLDADDFLELNYVELMMNAALQNEADLVCCDAYRWTNEGVRTPFYLGPKEIAVNNGIDFLEANLPTFLWAKLYKRETFVNLIAQKTNVSDDAFFNYQALPRCKKVIFLKENLYYYRYNNSSIMNRDRAYLSSQYLEHAIQRRDLLDNELITDKIRDLLLYDNIGMIIRYLRFVGYDRRIKVLIDVTFHEYKFPIPTAKHFRMGVFLLVAKFFPKIALKLTK